MPDRMPEKNVRIECQIECQNRMSENAIYTSRWDVRNYDEIICHGGGRSKESMFCGHFRGASRLPPSPNIPSGGAWNSGIKR